ncbi:hypothetical protein [Nitritalea halalkaliphila]|nr:hypothetical protein [Nitritalea halalkaliphila]
MVNGEGGYLGLTMPEEVEEENLTPLTAEVESVAEARPSGWFEI